MKEEELLTILQARIGVKVTALRKNMGYRSHADFAREYDIPRLQYWRMEKGTTNLDLQMLVKVMVIHGLTIEQFFTALPRETRKSGRSTRGSQPKKSSDMSPSSVECMFSTKEQNWRITITPA